MKDAIIGDNTLIVAPTGSGKTPVAIYIAIKHLEERWGAKKRKFENIWKFVKERYGLKNDFKK